MDSANIFPNGQKVLWGRCRKGWEQYFKREKNKNHSVIIKLDPDFDGASFLTGLKYYIFVLTINNLKQICLNILKLLFLKIGKSNGSSCLFKGAFRTLSIIYDIDSLAKLVNRF